MRRVDGVSPVVISYQLQRVVVEGESSGIGAQIQSASPNNAISSLAVDGAVVTELHNLAGESKWSEFFQSVLRTACSLA